MPVSDPTIPDPTVSAEMVARSRTVGEARWAPDPERLGWLEGFDGRVDLRLGPLGGPSTLATTDVAVTSVGAYGGGGWCWAGDEVVVATADGALVVLGPAGGRVRRVLSAEGRAFAPAVCGSMVAFCRETDDACDVAVVPLDGSEWPRRVSHADYAWDPAWSADGRSLAWHEWDLPNMPWDTSRILAADIDGLAVSGTRAIVEGDQVACGQPRFSPDGTGLAWVSDRDGWMNVWTAGADGSAARPLISEAHEHAEPSWGPGQRSYAWSPEGDEIVLCRNEAGFGRLVRAAVDGKRVVDVAKAWHRGLDWSPQGLVAVRSGACTPDAVVYYDRSWERRALAHGPAGGFEAEGEPEAVTWRVGNAKVHGLLYRPNARAAVGLIVDIHGGPTGQAVAEWRGGIAFWRARGWAVLRPNYRGSTGYGRRYMRSLDGRWGERDVGDIAAGIRAVGQRPGIDPTRVAVMGGSAGGMTTMLLCARHPDLVRAGVSVCGVADLAALARTTHRFESRYLDRLVGVLPDAAEIYAARSPVELAADIRVPLLILQGADDLVVPPAQADRIVAAIRQSGGDVEHQSYEGEGHGLRQLTNVVDELERAERFLDEKVLSR